MDLSKQVLLLFATSFIGFLPLKALAQSSKNFKELAESEVQSTTPIVEQLEVNPLATVQANFVPSPFQKKSQWILGAGMQTLQPEGQVNLDFVDNKDLSEAGPIQLWYLRAGKSFLLTPYWLKSWALLLQAGMGQIQNSLTTSGGQGINDVRLQAYLLALQTKLSFPLGRFFSFSPEVSVGSLNLTQVSSNSSARFSKRRPFWAPGLSLDFLPLEALAISIIYERREFLAPEVFSTQTDNWLFELNYSL